MKYVAVYVDQNNARWNIPVTKSGETWMLATDQGPQAISFYIGPYTAVAGGFLQFADYRLEDAPEGIRGCDFIQAYNAMRTILPWPTKPVEPPPATTESVDSRLHVESGGTWRAHKQAHAEQRLAQERQNRDQARGAIQHVPTDPSKILAARQLNNEIAKAMRPHGRGQGLLIGKE